MEVPERRFWLGVQWHPETGTDMRLFAALVDAARA
jgi:putative glutamine amidotransferase